MVLERLKSYFAFALDDVIPKKQKKLRSLLNSVFGRLFESSPSTASHNDIFRFMSTGAQNVKELLSKNGVDPDSREFQDIMFQVDRVFLIMMLNYEDATDSQRKQFATDFVKLIEDLRFKHINNEYFVGEFNKLIDFTNHQIGILSEKTTTQKQKENSFKLHLSHRQKNTFRLELKARKYTTTAASFLDFLNGNNTAKFTLNRQKLPHIAYLLSLMCECNPPLLKFSKEKGYLSHLEDALCHNGVIVAKYSLREMKRTVISRNPAIRQEVDGIFDLFKLA